MSPINFGKKSGNEAKIVTLGPKGGESAIFKADRSGFLKSYTDMFKDALGAKAEDIVAQDNADIRETRQNLKEADKQLREVERIASETEATQQQV